MLFHLGMVHFPPAQIAPTLQQDIDVKDIAGRPEPVVGGHDDVGLIPGQLDDIPDKGIELVEIVQHVLSHPVFAVGQISRGLGVQQAPIGMEQLVHPVEYDGGQVSRVLFHQILQNDEPLLVPVEIFRHPGLTLVFIGIQGPVPHGFVGLPIGQGPVVRLETGDSGHGVIKDFWINILF